jgi:hypothetical protein
MPDPITHDDLMAAMWSQPLSEAALQTLKAYIAQQRARDTELTALRERCKVLAEEVRAWRDGDLHCDMLGYLAEDPTGVGMREIIREARAATDAANALEDK